MTDATFRYGKDESPKWEWVAIDRFWYEERPRMIVSYYPGKTNPSSPDTEMSAFVNVEYQPTSEDVQKCMERALKAAGVSKVVINLRLRNWSGDTNAFWYADLSDEVIP